MTTEIFDPNGRVVDRRREEHHPWEEKPPIVSQSDYDYDFDGNLVEVRQNDELVGTRREFDGRGWLSKSLDDEGTVQAQALSFDALSNVVRRVTAAGT